MSMIDSIASMSMSLSTSKVATSYSIALTKKAMDNQELAAQQLLEMLPQTPALGQYIDTYA